MATKYTKEFNKAAKKLEEEIERYAQAKQQKERDTESLQVEVFNPENSGVNWSLLSEGILEVSLGGAVIYKARKPKGISNSEFERYAKELNERVKTAAEAEAKLDRYTSLEKQITTAGEELKGNEAARNTAQERVTDIDQKITAKNDELTKARQDLEAAKRGSNPELVAEYERKVSELKSDIKKLKAPSDKMITEAMYKKMALENGMKIARGETTLVYGDTFDSLDEANAQKAVYEKAIRITKDGKISSRGKTPLFTYEVVEIDGKFQLKQTLAEGIDVETAQKAMDVEIKRCDKVLQHDTDARARLRLEAELKETQTKLAEERAKADPKAAAEAEAKVNRLTDEKAKLETERATAEKAVEDLNAKRSEIEARRSAAQEEMKKMGDKATLEANKNKTVAAVEEHVNKAPKGVEIERVKSPSKMLYGGEGTPKAKRVKVAESGWQKAGRRALRGLGIVGMVVGGWQVIQALNPKEVSAQIHKVNAETQADGSQTHSGTIPQGDEKYFTDTDLLAKCQKVLAFCTIMPLGDEAKYLPDHLYSELKGLATRMADGEMELTANELELRKAMVAMYETNPALFDEFSKTLTERATKAAPVLDYYCEHGGPDIDGKHRSAEYWQSRREEFNNGNLKGERVMNLLGHLASKHEEVEATKRASGNQLESTSPTPPKKRRGGGSQSHEDVQTSPTPPKRRRGGGSQSHGAVQKEVPPSPTPPKRRRGGGSSNGVSVSPTADARRGLAGAQRITDEGAEVDLTRTGGNSRNA